MLIIVSEFLLFHDNNKQPAKINAKAILKSILISCNEACM